MGYTREKLQILGGGWNLLPPGDKTPKTDYLLAQNWRVDRYGHLVSRWGYPLKFSISGVGYAHSAANNGGDESDYYVAANNLAGTSPCNIYLNGSSTPLTTGLSGNRVGFASMIGWMFIMDRSQQVRHNVTSGLRSWGIAAPSTGFTAAAGTANSTGPSGIYTFYVTFATGTGGVENGFYETNPGAATASANVTLQNVNFTGLPASPGGELTGGVTNIYASGGGLGSAYLCASVAIGTSTAVWNTNNLTITNDGLLMPTTHDAPPAGQGLAGPYFSRLYTWVGNRLYYTPPGQPQYWNQDPAVGDWVDVGVSGENIQWCTCHNNVLMIYKQKSIWQLVGDPTTGTLTQMEDGVGLVNPWAIAPGSGAVDYFVAPGGLRACNMERTAPFGQEISPLFTSPITNNNTPMACPGSILPGPNYMTESLDCYAIALGYAMGKLYVAYGETIPIVGLTTPSGVLLVYDEQSKQWTYHRNEVISDRFHGFYFDGVMMVGLGGSLIPGTSYATGYNLDDFRGFETEDQGYAGGANTAIECVYQSHFEDAGQPDNEKCWLEIVVDCVVGLGLSAYVYVVYDNGTFTPMALLGTITGTGGRQTVSFPLGTNGELAKNISVAFYAQSTATSGSIELHNVYLYYYAEARLAMSAATLATDLGTATVKQCKELCLDIDTSYGAGGTVVANIYSDLPGNAIALRQSPTVPNSGRGLVKFPFAITDGYLWRLALTASTVPFRLYSARLLMRTLGVYVEAYESAAGFVWDSMEVSFESLMTRIPRAYAIALSSTPIKRFREISLEIETFNTNVTVSFLTDLPGETETVRWTGTVSTLTLGRRFVHLPLPAGTSAPIEGRMCRLQISGTGTFVLYGAAVELLAVGVYIEAYEGATGAVYDSREQDFGSAKPKEARELELDIETTSGNVTATLYCDLPGYTMAQVWQCLTVTTSGRQKIKLPLTLDAAPYDYPVGRMFRLIISGNKAFRLYEAKIKIRELGCYLTGDEAGALGVWDSTPQDFGTERLKEFRKLELDIQTDASTTLALNVWTDQPGGVIAASQFSTTLASFGLRQTSTVSLTPGIRGRLLEALITGVSGGGIRLFAGRVWWRPLNEPKAQWQWSPLPIEPTTPEWKWAAFEVNPTPPGSAATDPAQWLWGKLLEVPETPNTWAWVDVPFEVQG